MLTKNNNNVHIITILPVDLVRHSAVALGSLLVALESLVPIPFKGWFRMESRDLVLVVD